MIGANVVIPSYQVLVSAERSGCHAVTHIARRFSDHLSRRAAQPAVFPHGSCPSKLLCNVQPSLSLLLTVLSFSFGFYSRPLAHAVLVCWSIPTPNTHHPFWTFRSIPRTPVFRSLSVGRTLTGDGNILVRLLSDCDIAFAYDSHGGWWSTPPLGADSSLNMPHH